MASMQLTVIHILFITDIDIVILHTIAVITDLSMETQTLQAELSTI